MSVTEALVELESQVTERFIEKATERLPRTWQFDPATWQFDPATWRTGISGSGGAAPGPQFPREQWIVYPTRRVIALSIVARALEIEALTDDQWAQIGFLMAYGGKERLA